MKNKYWIIETENGWIGGYGDSPNLRSDFNTCWSFHSAEKCIAWLKKAIKESRKAQQPQEEQ